MPVFDRRRLAWPTRPGLPWTLFFYLPLDPEAMARSVPRARTRSAAAVQAQESGQRDCGGGFYEHYSDLPISLAWQAFGEKKGASSLAEIRQRTA